MDRQSTQLCAFVNNCNKTLTKNLNTTGKMRSNLECLTMYW